MVNRDLKELADITTPDRAFLSIYLSGSHSVTDIEKKLNKLRRVLKPGQMGKDEREYFDENVKTIEEYLQKNPPQNESLGIFTSQAIDYFKVISLPSPVDNVVRIDSYPYIRPLAEIYDDYEDVAVVVADNEKVRIFIVSSSVSGSEEMIKGNIKNHVKVGGWSQKRYERRRDNQLLQYGREIASALVKLDAEVKYGHVLLVGSREILRIVHENMPKDQQIKIIEKSLDLSRGEGTINHDIMELLSDEEQRSQQDYWETIRAEYLREGLAVVGLDEVLEAANSGRVDKAIIDRAFHPQVERCQNCDGLNIGETPTCAVCGSQLLFKVSVINEILDMLINSGAEYRFADSVPELGEVGGIAALLRY